MIHYTLQDMVKEPKTMIRLIQDIAFPCSAEKSKRLNDQKNQEDFGRFGAPIEGCRGNRNKNKTKYMTTQVEKEEHITIRGKKVKMMKTCKY